ncbi:MAG: efflux RND transporter periplasmic adaptor subunit [Calditrichia bacterium]
MKKMFLFILIFLFSMSLFQCSGEGSAEQVEKPDPGIPVQTLNLKPRSFSEYLEVTGTVEARSQIQIVVEEGGTLSKIIRDKGSFVRAGDTLAVLENKILESSYKEANAALQQAELDYSSKQVLFQKRAISENEYLVSKYGLERAKAFYELSKARYDKLFITAPLNGYVNNRFYDRGAYAMPMTPIFDFIDNEYIKVTAGVAERFLGDIHIGTPVEITFDAFPDIRLRAEVTFLTRSIEPLSRTFGLEVMVRNPQRKLAPQMIANLKLLRRSYQEKMVIPLDAVIESEEGRYVFVAENEQAVKKNVEVQAIQGDSVLVDGVAPYEKLVVVGQQALTEGDKIYIVSE